ncbi:MAG: leucine-rich repeat protein [Clostridia bacterium]|nr:leucine-rich repeat protein [Clostridia bacterium]
MGKRIVQFMVVMFLLNSLLIGVGIPDLVYDSAKAEQEQNYWTWDFSLQDWDYSHGVLMITGSGSIPDYPTSDDTPWADYRTEIDQIIIDEGITAIGSNAFSDIPNLIRVDFNEAIAPAIGDNAFLNTEAVFRYYTNNESWSEDDGWIYLPVDNQDESLQNVYYSDMDGWYVYTKDEMVRMSAAQAKEVTYRKRSVNLLSVPPEDVFNSLCNDWDVTFSISFESGCSGTISLSIPEKYNPMPSVFCSSDNMTIDICAAGKMTFLSVSAGNVNCQGNMQYLMLRTMPENSGADVMVKGFVDTLSLSGSDKWDAYKGSLALCGRIEEGIIYSNNSINVPNVPIPVPFEHLPVANLSIDTEGETVVLIKDGEINNESAVLDPNDLYNYWYVRENDQWRIGLNPKEGYFNLSSPGTVLLEPYKADFSENDIAYGEWTTVSVLNNEEPVSLNGQIRELMIENSTVIVNGPVWSLYDYPGFYDITINADVEYLYANGDNSSSRIMLGSDGSFEEGYRNRRLRGTEFFGPTSGPCDLLSGGQLHVLSWKAGQSIAFILPSDDTVSAAAGQSAIIDIEQLGVDDLTESEAAALDEALNDDIVLNVLDLKIWAYEMGSNDEASITDSISSLSEPVEITVKATPDIHVIRLHEEDGTIFATPLANTVRNGTITFESDLFSKYALVSSGGEFDPSLLLTLRLPQMITRIEDNAFENGVFQAIIIPDGCTYVGKEAFKNCKDLIYVSYSAITQIDPTAFDGCDSIIEWEER